MPGRIRIGRCCAALGALLLGGCAELDGLIEARFPPQVPGLAADQPWVHLPVGQWLTEGGIEAEAISACFAPTCSARLAVGLFRASGRDAAELMELAVHPARLQRFIEEKDRADGKARRVRPRALVSVERLQQAEYAGFLVRLSRTDGSRPAAGLVLARASGGASSAVVVIGDNETAIRRTASEVLAGLVPGR